MQMRKLRLRGKCLDPLPICLEEQSRSRGEGPPAPARLSQGAWRWVAGREALCADLVPNVLYVQRTRCRGLDTPVSHR